MLTNLPPLSRGQMVQKPGANMNLSGLHLGGYHITRDPTRAGEQWPDGLPTLVGSPKALDLKPTSANHSGRLLVSSSRFERIYDDPDPSGHVGHMDLVYLASDMAALGLVVAFDNIETADSDGGHFLWDGGSGTLYIRNWRISGKVGYGFPFNISLIPGCVMRVVLDNVQGGFQFVAKRGAVHKQVLQGLWYRNCTGPFVLATEVAPGKVVQTSFAAEGVVVNQGAPPVCPFWPSSAPAITPAATPVTTTQKPAGLTDVLGFTLHRTAVPATEYVSAPDGDVNLTLGGFTYKFKAKQA